MIPSLAPPCQAIRWSRLGAAAVALAALLLALTMRPALAADPQVKVSVTQRWQLDSTQGMWTPYAVTVTDSGSTAFTGDVLLLPGDTRAVAPNSYPVYRSPVSVNPGRSRTVLFDVIDAPSGYVVEVRDPSGRPVANSSPAARTGAESALGILSDLTQAEQKIAAPLHTLTQVDSSLARFASAQDFPTSAVYLSGLNGLVIDQFDSAALSQAQVQALKDYVGLGGALIEAGGPSWRRTLLSLPPELVPMRPTSTGTASLAALAALVGRTTDATAQVASGQVTGGRATLIADDGQPLVIEGAYGAGRVVELAFDPFGEPFDTQTELAGMAWSHAISGALSGVLGGNRPATSSGGFGSSIPSGGNGLVAAPGEWAPGFGNGSDPLSSILGDIPAASAPPVGLLGGLLVAYVLLAGLLSYLFLKAAGRRQLMWVSVPLIALVFTVSAYGVGFGSRGSNFLVTEVQVQRLAPEGAVESYSFDGVYPPHKGDITLTLPANTLASTAVALGSLGGSNGDALITAGPRPQVFLANLAVWTMRPVQTLAVTHPWAYEPRGSLPVDAQLRVQRGHVVGTIANLTQRAIGDVELVSASGSQAVLATVLPAGATAPVDADLSPGPGPIASAADMARAVPGVSEGSRVAMIRLAATQAVNSVPGSLAVVGFTQAAGAFTVDGARPGRSAVAAVVEPISLLAADALAGIAPHARLVSNYTLPDGGTQADVYDFDLPAGLTVPTALSYQMQDTSQPNVRSVEVYDWTQHSWRLMPKQALGARGQSPSPLTAGELAQGVVRVRVVEGVVTNAASLAVGDLPQ